MNTNFPAAGTTRVCAEPAVRSDGRAALLRSRLYPPLGIGRDIACDVRGRRQGVLVQHTRVLTAV
jgi:hypothetical protein